MAWGVRNTTFARGSRRSRGGLGAVAVKVLNCILQNVAIIARLPEHSVAVKTEKGPDRLCRVVVIYVQFPAIAWLSADCALSTLKVVHRQDLNYRKPISPTKMIGVVIAQIGHRLPTPLALPLHAVLMIFIAMKELRRRRLSLTASSADN